MSSVLAAGVVLAGCGSSGSPSSSVGASRATASFYTGGTPSGTPVRGGVATVDQPEPLKTLDPVGVIQTNECAVAAEIFDQLFEYLPGSRVPQPALVKSWTVSPDHLTYTFHIRPGVSFSNGEPLTAEDVAYSLNRQFLPIAPAGKAFTNGWKSVTAVGPLTVKLQLTEPRAAVIGDMGLIEMSIVPKAVVEREGEKAFALHPIGTGPFMFKSASSGYSTVTLVRNPRYWRAGKPYLDGLVFNTVTETNARILAVRTGAATIATGISFSQVPSLRSTPGVRMLVEPMQNAMPVFFNDAIAPLNDVKVRRALNYATPREAIINAVFKGMAELSNDPVGRLQYWDPKVPTYPFDLAKAKELLRGSSAPHGFSATITVPSGEPDAALVASILQGSWAKLGVHLKILAQEPATFFTNWFASKFQIAVLTDESYVTEQYPPDLALFLNFDYLDSSTDASGYKSARMISLIRRAMAGKDEPERQRLFGEIQKLLYEDAPIISLAELPSRTLVSDKLRGFTVQPGNFMRMDEMWLLK